jgi:hypothetical protein
MTPDSEPRNTAAFVACQDLSGKFVGRYSIRSLLGSGGMGDASGDLLYFPNRRRLGNWSHTLADEITT